MAQPVHPGQTAALCGRWLWLFPASYALHIAEEGLAGQRFCRWIGRVTGREVSPGVFASPHKQCQGPDQLPPMNGGGGMPAGVTVPASNATGRRTGGQISGTSAAQNILNCRRPDALSCAFSSEG